MAAVLLGLTLVACSPAAAAVSAGDSGWVWQTPEPQIEDLGAVALVDDSEGWAVVAGGTIRHTTDGGSAWSRQVSGTGATLTGVSFADAEHGWAVGTTHDARERATGNVILVTADGGASWTRQAAGVRSGLDAVTFADRRRGWAVAPPARCCAPPTAAPRGGRNAAAAPA